VADEKDVLLQLYSEERAQARQSEDQRATLTNLILLMSGGGLAFIAALPLRKSSLAISIDLIVLGVYGAITTRKYFERWLRHWHRSYALQSQLFLHYPSIPDRLLTFTHERREDAYEKAIKKRFPYTSQLRVYNLWTGFHILLAIAGVIVSVIIVLNG